MNGDATWKCMGHIENFKGRFPDKLALLGMLFHLG